MTRWLHSTILLCAAGLLPLGAVQAQDKSYKVVAAELKASIEAGEITAEQAGHLLETTGAKVRIAISAGEMTAEEGRALMVALRKAAAAESKGMTREDYARLEKKLKEAVAAGKLTEEQARERLGAMRRQMAGKRRSAREEYAALERRLKAAVAAGKITEEEAREQLENFKRRLAARGKRGSGLDPAMVERIRGALSERGLEEKQIEGVLRAMTRILPAMQSKGASYELDPRMRAYLEGELGLTGAQVEVVVALSRRVAGAIGKREVKGRGDNADWEAIKRRIEGAVERGDMTREEADAKYAELKKDLGEDKAKRKRKNL